jgi:UPF0176 protein
LSTDAPAVLNVSAYKFVTLDGLPAWRDQLLQAARKHVLRGTVLLAPEGINLFLAGADKPVRAFMADLLAHEAMQGMEVKYSVSTQVPFKRLWVKIKPEIIRMNAPAIRPDAGQRAPSVDATTLARWLKQGHDDAGRPVLMLDTRNDFEVALGRFEGAQHWSLSKFSDFPKALSDHGHALAGHTVVTYCTGGIRCEKAALLMQAQGHAHVLQLDGGILRYFETVGDAHWQGPCFVFDERLALDGGLLPVDAPHAL